MMQNDPLARLPDVPTFSLTSPAFAHGSLMPVEQRSAQSPVTGGRDESPELRWEGAPAETKSFALTCYDPDAPTGSGFWHWLVLNIPAVANQLPSGAGDSSGSKLPEGSVQLPNDAGLSQYVGAAPPAGHGSHRYFFILTALDTDTLDIPSGTSPARIGSMITRHTIGRAVLVGTAETPAS